MMITHIIESDDSKVTLCGRDRSTVMSWVRRMPALNAAFEVCTACEDRDALSTLAATDLGGPAAGFMAGSQKAFLDLLDKVTNTVYPKKGNQ